MYKLFCAILGERTDSFPINIDESQTVGDLKGQIKKENAQLLISIDARTLILYKVDIDIAVNNAAYQQVIEQISDKMVTTPMEPLINPSQTLSDIFGQSTPAGRRINILVERPPGQSTDPIDPSVCDTVAETVLTRPVIPPITPSNHSLQSLLIVQHCHCLYASYSDHTADVVDTPKHSK